MRRLDSITDSMEVSLSKFWEMVKDREAWSAAVYGTVKSQTWLSNWTALSIMLQVTETLIVYLSIYFSCDIVSLKTYYEAQYVTTSFSFLNCPSRQAQKSLWWRKGRWRINLRTNDNSKIFKRELQWFRIFLNIVLWWILDPEVFLRH